MNFKRVYRSVVELVAGVAPELHPDLGFSTRRCLSRWITRKFTLPGRSAMFTKIILVATTSLAASLGIAVAAGWRSHDAAARHVFDAKVGDFIIIRAIDLDCRVYRRDP